MWSWLLVGFVLGAFVGAMVAVFIFCCLAVNALAGKEKQHDREG